MNFREYEEIIRNVLYTDTLEYKMAFMWLRPEIVPLCVTSIGKRGSDIIRIPGRVINEYGSNVPVVAFSHQAFSEKSNITDIILPNSIERFPNGAFEGCTGL